MKGNGAQRAVDSSSELLPTIREECVPLALV